MVAQRFLVPFVGVQIPVSLPLLRRLVCAGRFFVFSYAVDAGIFTCGVPVRFAPGLVGRNAPSEQIPVSLPLLRRLVYTGRLFVCPNAWKVFFFCAFPISSI